MFLPLSNRLNDIAQMLIAGDLFNEPSRFMLLMLFSCPASITSIWKAIDPFALLRLIYLSSDLVRF